MSTSSDPSFTVSYFPFFTNCLERSGSRIASISSPIASIMRTLPLETAISTLFNHPFCESWMRARSVPTLPLIHVCPCSYGSMMSGYLLQEVTTAAFSRDTLSAGRPSPCQTAWSDGVARTPSGSTPRVYGIFLSMISLSQTNFQSLSL